MIDIKIGLDGKPNINKILLGNKYENNDEIIHFDLDSSFDGYYKYLYASMKQRKNGGGGVQKRYITNSER